MSAVRSPADLKALVSGDKAVHFRFYRKGELWYATDCGFEFPVPINDTGDADFLATDRAMLFMRYIRKHLAVIEQGRQETAPEPALLGYPRC